MRTGSSPSTLPAIVITSGPSIAQMCGTLNREGGGKNRRRFVLDHSSSDTSLREPD